PAIAQATPTPGLRERARTFADLEDDVARLAAAHRAANRAGASPVAILCANRVDVLLHVLALARTGVEPLPLNHRLRAEEQAAALGAAGAKSLVADCEVAAPLMESAAGTGLRAIWTGAGGPAAREGFDLAAWLRAHPEERFAGPAARDAAVLLCTSGTTGVPKVARLSSRSLLSAIGRIHALPVGQQRGLRAGRDAMIVALPLTHVMGLGTALGALCAGVKLIHLDRFEAEKVLGRIEADQPNVFVGVPTMYADLEQAGAAQRDLSSIELWVSAADAMPPDRARRFQQYGALGRVGKRRLGTAAFADVYGMVELGGPAAVRFYPPGPRIRPLPAVGFVLPGFSARVVGPDGRQLRMGVAGELELRGAGVFSGYQGGDRPGEDDWFPTGDLARLGPLGTFGFVGRKADRLKVGGFSVFPAEVEAELRGHAAVAELAIVGVPDERLGERPVALVVAKEGFDAEQFLGWAAERVAPYRRPRAALPVQALPVGKNGKLDRRGAGLLAQRMLEEAR
ncbi:MAG TPA: long-chain fatty acid--CoA ligase, partial [Myxococcales bacterium]|nr:long-chain fatty acid--CoA ligase [Myxococcales bacterium]